MYIYITFNNNKRKIMETFIQFAIEEYRWNDSLEREIWTVQGVEPKKEKAIKRANDIALSRGNLVKITEVFTNEENFTNF